MLSKLKKVIADDNELDSETLRVLSLLFLLISGVMSFFKYTNVGWLWNSSITFQPSYISTIFAVFLIAPLYLRGVLKWSKSLYSLLSLMLILLVFASFTELAIGGNKYNRIIIYLLVAAVLLSWLGIRAVAGASWLLALAAAIYAAIENNLSMGINGFVYVGSGFIGLVLHSGLNPGELFEGIKDEYSKVGTMAKNTAKSHIKESFRRVT
ncbi:MAG: hypothetical protein FHP94_01410 [Denitromonas halophila]|nr:MAG: hypothetical protein FHP94_01410 [Denitromonas halophila]